MALDAENVISNFNEILKLCSSPELPEFAEALRLHSSFTKTLASNLFTTGNQFTKAKALTTLVKYSQKASKGLLTFLQHKKKVFYEKFRIALKKAQLVVDHFQEMLSLPEDDLAFLPETHDRKEALRKITQTIQFANPKLLMSQLKAFAKMYSAMKAAFFKSLAFKKSATRDLITGWLISYYSVLSSSSRKRCAKLFDAFCDIKTIKVLWNLPDSSLLTRLGAISLPNIKFTKVIYLPRLAPSLLTNSEFINNEAQDWNDESQNDNMCYSQQQDSKNYRVKVRVISNFVLPALAGSSKIVPNTLVEKIVIHIHGGAYIAMSSFSHQGYTREWAKDINVPIFSIDYRLAPEDPFPAGLDDVWQAYYWIVKYCHKYLNIEPKTIVLTGDSAGGNFVSALTLKAIMSGFRVPDGLLLVYPSVNIDIRYFSPSFLLTYNDLFLTHGSFYVIRDNYVDKDTDKSHFFVSPIFAPVEFVQKFPRTEMIITLNDPLSHDGRRFAEKLLSAGVSVKINEYPEGIHGMISLGNKFAVPVYSESVTHCACLLKSLLGNA